MAMTEYKTRTGTETCAEGELKAIFFNELKTKKDYGTKELDSNTQCKHHY